MAGWRRGVLWVVAVAAGLTCVGLALLLWLKDLNTAGTVAGLAADTLTLVMTVFAVRGLLQSGQLTANGVMASGEGAVAHAAAVSAGSSRATTANCRAPRPLLCPGCGSPDGACGSVRIEVGVRRRLHR